MILPKQLGLGSPFDFARSCLQGLLHAHSHPTRRLRLFRLRIRLCKAHVASYNGGPKMAAGSFRCRTRVGQFRSSASARSSKCWASAACPGSCRFASSDGSALHSRQPPQRARPQIRLGPKGAKGAQISAPRRFSFPLPQCPQPKFAFLS